MRKNRNRVITSDSNLRTALILVVPTLDHPYNCMTEKNDLLMDDQFLHDANPSKTMKIQPQFRGTWPVRIMIIKIVEMLLLRSF